MNNQAAQPPSNGDVYNVRSNLNPQNSTAALQSYLRTISRFNPAIPPITVDGIYGPETQNAIEIFQRVYHIPTGQDDTDYLTWIAARDVANRYTYRVAPGNALIPVPHRDALVALSRSPQFITLLQLMLNTIAQTYPDLPVLALDGVWSEQLLANINQLNILFNRPPVRELDGPTWDVLAFAYNNAVTEQYPETAYTGNIYESQP